MLELRVGNTYTDIVGDISSKQWKDLRDKLSFRPKDFMFSSAYNRWICDVDGKKIRRAWNGITPQIWKNTKRCYYPSGLQSLVRDYLEETKCPFKIIDCRKPPVRNIELQFSDIFEKRDYQSVICNKSVVKQRGIIHASTGSGKTSISAGIINLLGVSPFLFFVTSIDLLIQAKTALSEFLTLYGKPLNVGQIGGGEIDIQDINVLTVQTAVRALGEKWDKDTKFDEEDEYDPTPIEERAEDIKNLLHGAQGAICDECITGDSIVITKEGSEKISSLSKKIGKELLSFDGYNAVWKKITNFYQRGTQKTLKILLTNGMSIRCTANHPILTRRGWKEASQIRQDDEILCFASVDAVGQFVFPEEVQADSPNTICEKFGARACDTNYVKVKSIENHGEEEVFDISVEDTHCFFANGLLVHNCQHWKAKTCQIVTRSLKNCYYIYGVSATPYRDQGDDLLIQACFGKKIAEITASELIETIDPLTGKPYLMRPNIKIVHLRNKRTPYKQWQAVYKDQVVDNTYYNGVIANVSTGYIDAGRLVLILVQQINHGKYLESTIPGSLFVSGASSKSKRLDSLNRLRQKDLKCLISTSLPYNEIILIKDSGLIKGIEIGDLCHNYANKVKQGMIECLCSFDGKHGSWGRVSEVHVHNRMNNVVRVQTDKGEDVFVTENHSLVSCDLVQIPPKESDPACVPISAPRNNFDMQSINVIELLRDICDNSIEVEILGITQAKVRKMKSDLKFYLGEKLSKSTMCQIKKRVQDKPESYFKSLQELFSVFKYYKFKYRAKLKDAALCKYIYDHFEGRVYIRRSRKNFSLPVNLKITNDLAVISGLMCGDGHIKHHTGKTHRSIYAFDFAGLRNMENSCEGHNDPDKMNVRKIFIDCFIKAFGTNDLYQDDKHIRFRSKLMYYLFISLGHVTKDGQKKVPEYILNSSADIQKHFLLGLYLSDGSKKMDYRDEKKNPDIYTAICIHNTSRPLIIVIAHLLRMLNMKFYMYTSPSPNGWTRKYVVSIIDDLLHLKTTRVKNKVINISDRSQKIVEKVSNNDNYVYDISVDGCHNFVAGCGILCHNTIFDEGIDVRPLDTIILAGQGKSRVRAMQRVGRVLRPFPGKQDPTVIDFMLHQPYLEEHAEERIKMYSTEPMFRIEHIDPNRII